jgi:hypothetical protein
MIRKLSFSEGSSRRRDRWRLGALALVCSAIAPMAALGANAPDWLQAASKVDIGQLASGSAAVVVAQSTDFTVDGTGKFVQRERRAIRVLNRQAADPYLRAYGEESVDFKVVSIQSWSISTNGRVVQSDKKDINTLGDFANFELFSDARIKFVNVPGAEEGSLVGYEIVREGRLPIQGQQFDMEDTIPVKLAEVHVSVPSGSLRWFVNHPDRVEVVSQSPTAAAFRSLDRAAIPQEESAPPWQSVAAIVTVNYDPGGAAAIQSWEDAGRADYRLNAEAEKSNADILTEVDRLTTGQTDLLAKLNAAYTFVSREIRYVAVEIGIGGYQPHAAADVFRYKYGDCKDKATLLLTMLDHIGLRGNSALVGTRLDVEADPKVPTLRTFDHMIVALPVPPELRTAVSGFAAYDAQTNILWMDPTSEYSPLGQLPTMDQGVFSLIVYPDHGVLQRIPETSPERNGMDYAVRVQLAADGTGKADVEMRYEGTFNESRHAFYRNRSMEDIRHAFEARVANYVTQASFQRATAAGTEENRQQIVENVSFTGNFATATTGDSWFFQPLFLTGINVPEVGTRPRHLALDLGVPYRVKGEYRIELPTGMRVERVPEKASLKSEYGELQTEYSASGNVLVAKSTLSFAMSRIPPEKYAEFRDFVNAVSRAERLRLRAIAAAQ